MSKRQDDLKQQNPSQQRFLQQAKATLDEAEQQLDGTTQTRLRAARREALAAAGKPRLPPWLMPVSGLAVAATVAALTVSLWQVPPADNGFAALEDIALLSDEIELEFYQELEFYAWVADGAPAVDAAGEGDGNDAG